MQWIKRNFDFDFPVEDYPDIITRLRSTLDRIEDLIKDIRPSVLKMRKEGKWSIQEHIGHLFDLEPLFLGRLDDFEKGINVLRPADMTNRKTYEANHNLKRIATILKALKRERGKIITRLDSYSPDMFSRTAQHPRLNKPMRLIDSLFFQAEHDDHHLGVIRD